MWDKVSRMAIRTELSFRIANSPGSLAAACDTLADTHINVLALHLEGTGRLRLLVDNPLLAASTLRAARFDVEQREVLMVTMPNAPGALAGLARLLSTSGVNVDYAYAAAVEGSPMAVAVFGVPDAQRAAAAAGM
jgi:hypothetical protein